jgi:hypothetical protein
MAKTYNGARMTTATTGTGTITLGSAVTGYLTFAAAGIANGDVVSYGIVDGSNFECGIGTYTSTGTTLTRTVTVSSNSNTAISLSGSAQVYLTARKEDLLMMTETQAVNTVLAGPSSGGAAAPTFRGIAAADVSSLVGLVYLGTVSVVSTAISDTTIVANNNSKYRSFLFIGTNIMTSAAGSGVLMQLHHGGAFDTTNANYSSTTNNNSGSGSGGSGNNGSGTAGFNLQTGGVQTPGLSFITFASDLGNASTKKMFTTFYNGIGNNATPPSLNSGTGAGFLNVAAAVDGFQLASTGTGGFTAGKIDIYGLL